MLVNIFLKNQPKLVNMCSKKFHGNILSLDENTVTSLRGLFCWSTR